jgi:hypothetical protein
MSAATAWNAETPREEYVAGDAAMIAAIISHEEKDGCVETYPRHEAN